MKKNKLKIIYIYLFAVIILVGIFLIVKKIEAPAKEEVKSNIIQEIPKPEIKIDENIKQESYMIKDYSLVVPKDSKGNKKVVLLTIDDGPSPRTKEIITILKKHNVKAIFFINGSNDKDHAGIIADTAKEGYIIGNHTWSHLDLKKEKDLTKIDKEITKNSELIKQITGSVPKFFRPPYGDITPYVKKFVKDNGMIFMNWSDAAKDWEKSTKDKNVFVGNVLKNLSPGAIILIHEHPWSLANLDSMLSSLEEKGYKFVDPKDIVE
ncbi:MAG: polysaccharide deacetylase family protein [Bacteroidetes bacterium]|nr:polysaccharide deacetylase family protein [Bacteroidota bacterium]